MGKAWEALQAEDAPAPLDAPDFHSLLFERLGVGSAQVFEVFEVLDGPDYGADGGGLVTLQVLKDGLILVQSLATCRKTQKGGP